MAEKALQKDLALSRQKFTPSKVVRNVIVTEPGITRRKLAATAKNLVQEDDHQEMLEGLQRLEKQGHMSRCSTPEGAQVWAKTLSLLADEHLKFALNSSIDTLPHNANLHLWKKKGSSVSLCGEEQLLIHVLNTCKIARDNRRLNSRHNALLREIASVITVYLPPHTDITTDLGAYSFPKHIVPTDLRPDVVWWDHAAKKLSRRTYSVF